MNQPRRSLNFWPVALLLCFATVAAYWPVLSASFIVCDDPDYVTQNPLVLGGLTWSAAGRAFTTMTASNWHPVTWLSHMLDVSLFGVNSAAHHGINLAFHCLNACLLLALLSRLTGAFWRSAFVAALFALHPLHVESVAWVSERKDVLSTFFGLLSLIAYARFAEFRAPSSGFRVGGFLRSRWYWVSVSCLALGLMSKPMLVTWPFVMLLLDVWPLRRLDLSTLNSQLSTTLKPLLIEKIPLFALSVLSAVMTVVAQQKGGAVASMSVVPWPARIANASESCAAYLGKTFWPVDLAAYYPHRGTPNWFAASFAAILLAIVSVVAIKQIRSRPWLCFGWFWFLGTLIPVIGIVQVGMQAMADRYTYIPHIGLFVGIVWFCAEFFMRHAGTKIPVAIAMVALLATLGIRTRSQSALWKDSETLYHHALSVTTDNHIAHMNLGSALLLSGKIDEAGTHFADAVRISPDYAEAISNLGFVQAMRGEHAEAESHYRRALQLKPGLTRIHFLLGSLLDATGRDAEAVSEYRLALADNRQHVPLLNNLAWALATSPDDNIRNGHEAIELARAACEASAFKEPLYIGTLAAAFAEAGKFDDAITTAIRARDVARAIGMEAIAKRNEELAALYARRQAVRE